MWLLLWLTRSLWHCLLVGWKQTIPFQYYGWWLESVFMIYTDVLLRAYWESTYHYFWIISSVIVNLLCSNCCQVHLLFTQQLHPHSFPILLSPNSINLHHSPKQTSGPKRYGGYLLMAFMKGQNPSMKHVMILMVFW